MNQRELIVTYAHVSNLNSVYDAYQEGYRL